MTMRLLAVLLAVAGSGCATFSTLTPGSDSTKGVWVSKTTSLFGWQLSDQEVLYCFAHNPAQPSCARAQGAVHASVQVQQTNN
jgi:hypothetical protein